MNAYLWLVLRSACFQLGWSHRRNRNRYFIVNWLSAQQIFYLFEAVSHCMQTFELLFYSIQMIRRYSIFRMEIKRPTAHLNALSKANAKIKQRLIWIFYWLTRPSSPVDRSTIVVLFHSKWSWRIRSWWKSMWVGSEWSENLFYSSRLTMATQTEFFEQYEGELCVDAQLFCCRRNSWKGKHIWVTVISWSDTNVDRFVSCHRDRHATHISSDSRLRNAKGYPEIGFTYCCRSTNLPIVDIHIYLAFSATSQMTHFTNIYNAHTTMCLHLIQISTGDFIEVIFCILSKCHISLQYVVSALLNRLEIQYENEWVALTPTPSQMFAGHFTHG